MSIDFTPDFHIEDNNFSMKLSSGIPEAPSDNKTYGRKNKSWSEIATVDVSGKADKTALDLANRRIDALFKVNEGQTFDFDVDTATCYSATVPSGAVADSVTMIGGKSVVMNQIARPITKQMDTYAGVTISNVTDDSFVLNGTATEAFWTADNLFRVRVLDSYEGFVENHKYFVSLNGLDSSMINSINFHSSNVTHSIDVSIGCTIISCSQLSWGMCIHMQVKNGAVFNNTLVKVNIIDITAMFGSGNEPTTVQQVKAMLPNEYYAYNTGEIIHAPVKSVVVKDDDSVVTSTTQIPQAIQSLTGYGWSAGSVYNEVDYANKKYIQRVSRVDLGSLNVEYHTSPVEYFIVHPNKKYGSNILCHMYTNITSMPSVSTMNNMEMKGNENVGNDSVIIRNLTYTDAQSFKTAMNGVYLYYELATPIETDISSLIETGFLEAFEVESGGSITFVSDTQDNYRLPVPNTNEFIVKLNEV